jgi:NAD-dependent deacetylase
MDAERLAEIARSEGPVVFLTGAGISAESGIPTFRGQEGYWQVGSRNYHPTEMATAEAFARMPEEVWRWYLYRRGVCRRAEPHAAHRALVRLEQALGARFLLVTQNVDGLHLRAGSERTYQIHGNIDFCRCTAGCAPPLRPLAMDEGWDKERPLDGAERAMLTCACGAWLRPHVLWFDEYYDEPLFKYESAQRAARDAAVLVVVGTSGATSLPSRMCEIVAARGAPLWVVDPAPTPFSELAQASPRGLFLRGTACEVVPPLVEQIASY